MCGSEFTLVIHSLLANLCNSGLDESAEDAPDIRANTFLAEVTDAQLQEIGYGFLGHRQRK